MRLPTWTWPVLIALLLLLLLQASMTSSGTGAQANGGHSKEGEVLTMIDSDQMKLMEFNIKRVILKATRSSCNQLHKHLNLTPSSLDCLGQHGAEMMLKLAISLEETFGPEILSLILKQ